MRVMSIDASTKSTGIAIFFDGKLETYKCLTESSKDVYKRIPNMADQILKVCEEYKPDAIIMEDVIPEDCGHKSSTFKALMYLQGQIVLVLHNDFPEIEFYVSSEWRKKCGIKTGPHIKRPQLKAAAMKKVKEDYSIEANDDICDAICIGWAYTHETIVTEDGFEFK